MYFASKRKVFTLKISGHSKNKFFRVSPISTSLICYITCMYLPLNARVSSYLVLELHNLSPGLDEKSAKSIENITM